MSRALMIAICFSSLISYPAAAGTESDARALFDQAKQLYQSNQYSSAMEIFRKSAALYDAASAQATNSSERQRIAANATLLRRWYKESACMDHSDSQNLEELRDLVGETNSINDARYHDTCSEFLGQANFVMDRIERLRTSGGQTDSHVQDNLSSATEIIWSSGSTTFRSVSIGDTLTVYFTAPSAEFNADAGQVLLEGVQRQGAVEGKAYAYRSGCRTVEFHLSGTLENTRQIELKGYRPTFDGGCESKSTSPIKLTLVYSRAAGSGGASTTRAMPAGSDKESSDNLFAGVETALDGLKDFEKALAAMGIDEKCSKSGLEGLSKDCKPLRDQPVLKNVLDVVPVGLKCKDENDGVFELMTLYKAGEIHRERMTFSNGLPVSYSDEVYDKQIGAAWSLWLIIDNKIPGDPKIVFVDDPDGTEIDDFKSVNLHTVLISNSSFATILHIAATTRRF